MCTSPVSIRTNSLSFNVKGSRLRQIVPCGKCDECRENRSMDWQVRNYYEYLKTRENGGQTIYLTLTFNDRFLPRFNGVSCFNWDLVDKFVKRLRSLLKDNGYDCTLRLFLCSEYGSKYRRPHHHALFYLTGKFPSPYIFKCYVAQAWADFDKKTKIRQSYGFIKQGKYGLVVNSPLAVLYVCKYVCKDLAFQGHAFRIFLGLVRLYISLYGEPSCPLGSFRHRSTTPSEYLVLRQQFIREFNHFNPFIKYSLGTGSSAIDHLSDKDICEETIRLPSSTQPQYRVKLPSYLCRKLYFDRIYNDNTGKYDLYRLNNLGCHHFYAKAYDSLGRVLEREKFSYQSFRSSLNPQFVYGLTDEEVSMLDSHFEDVVETLPLYRLVYRGFLFDEVCLHGDLFSNFDSRLSYHLQSRSIYASDQSFPMDRLSMPQILDLERQLCDLHPSFYVYETICSALDKINGKIRKDVSAERFKRKESANNYRQTLKTEKYENQTSDHLMYRPLHFDALVTA